MNAGLSASSQVGEVLAIKLLNNGTLSEETLINAKPQIILLLQAPEKGTLDMKKEIPKHVIDEMKESSSNLENRSY